MKPFRLSGRQLKELNDRGMLLTIAIPLPLGMATRETSDRELVDLVSNAIESVEPRNVKSVRRDVIAVDAISKSDRGNIGAIVTTERADSVLHLSVSVAVAEIVFAAVYRGRNAGPQWPALNMPEVSA